MFERFTERARRVIILAQEEAKRLNHSVVGTEHILLGIIREGEGLASKVLESLNISLERMRAEIEGAIGRGERAPHEEVSFAPRAKKVLELALDESRRLGHKYIGTEHLLLGLIREGEGIAARVLEAMGADLDRVRVQVVYLLGEEGTTSYTKQAGKTPTLDDIYGAFWAEALKVHSAGRVVVLGAQRFVMTGLALWFAVAVAASVLGVFAGPDPLQALFLLMLSVLLLTYLDVFRLFVHFLNPRRVVLLQTFRVVGVVFLVLHARGVLPASFALPAGWGDIAIGLTAPLVAFGLMSRTPAPKRVLILWNVAGMLDLVIAVSLGILASPTPAGLLARGITTGALGDFPVSLIPTFLVPLAFIAHLISIHQIRMIHG